MKLHTEPTVEGGMRDLLEVVLTEFLWAEKNYAAALAEQTGLSMETAEAILYDEMPLDAALAARIAAAFGIERDGFWDLEPEPVQDRRDRRDRRESGIQFANGNANATGYELVGTR